MYDNWIAAYENGAKLQFPAMERLPHFDSRESVMKLHMKGYQCPPDQLRCLCQKLGQIKQKDQEWSLWLAASYPKKAFVPQVFDPGSPSMGGISLVDSPGTCPMRDAQSVQACFVNSNFFNAVKAAKESPNVLRDMLQAFFTHHDPANLDERGVAVMDPVIKTYKGFAELADIRLDKVDTSFEDVGYIASFADQLKDFRGKNIATDLNYGQVYTDFLREDRTFWAERVREYCAKLAAIHHRKPQLAELESQLSQALKDLRSIKVEPGHTYDSTQAIAVLTEYQEAIIEHRMEVGSSRCLAVDAVASELVTAIAGKEVGKDVRDEAKLQKSKDFAIGLNMQNVGQQISDSLLETQKSGHLGQLAALAAVKPATWLDVTKLMEAWQRCVNLSKPDELYLAMFPNFLQAIGVVLAHSRKRDMNWSQFGPAVNWMVMVCKNNRFISVNDLGNDCDTRIANIGRAIGDVCTLTEAAKHALEHKKKEDGMPLSRLALLEMHEALKHVKTTHTKMFTNFDESSKLCSIEKATGTFLGGLFEGDGKHTGYKQIIGGWSREILEGHQKQLKVSQDKSQDSAYGANCSKDRPWYEGLDKKKVADKKLRDKYEKHLGQLDGRASDEDADALYNVMTLVSLASCPCAQGNSVFSRCEGDASV